jgi:hypothetical protein
MPITNFSDVNLKVAAVSGGSAGDITVTGISTEDSLAAVIDLDFSGGALADLTSEFSITADDTINNTGGTGSNDLLVFYFDKDLASR